MSVRFEPERDFGFSNKFFKLWGQTFFWPAVSDLDGHCLCVSFDPEHRRLKVIGFRGVYCILFEDIVLSERGLPFIQKLKWPWPSSIWIWTIVMMVPMTGQMIWEEVTIHSYESNIYFYTYVNDTVSRHEHLYNYCIIIIHTILIKRFLSKNYLTILFSFCFINENYSTQTLVMSTYIHKNYGLFLKM